MDAQAYNPSLFIADFVTALERSNWPAYPSRKWWNCLRQADEHDLARRLTNYYQSQDAAVYNASPVTYLDELYVTSVPRMNGHPLRSTVSFDESYAGY